MTQDSGDAGDTPAIPQRFTFTSSPSSVCQIGESAAAKAYAGNRRATGRLKASLTSATSWLRPSSFDRVDGERIVLQVGSHGDIFAGMGHDLILIGDLVNLPIRSHQDRW